MGPAGMIIECQTQGNGCAKGSRQNLPSPKKFVTVKSGVSGFYDILLYAGIPLFEHTKQGDRTWIRFLTR